MDVDIDLSVGAEMDVNVVVALLHRLFHNRNSGFEYTTWGSGSGLPPGHRAAAPGIQLSAQRAARSRRAFCCFLGVSEQGEWISVFLDTLLFLVILPRSLLAFEIFKF
jgi:hypothetical protein